MHIKWFTYLFIYIYVIDKIFCEKYIIFKTLQCSPKSQLIRNLECSNDDTSLSFSADTVKEIAKYFGLSNINLYISGNKNVMQLKGLRTEFCETRSERKRPNLMSLVNVGIYNSINNYPQRCPLLRNTTYYLKRMQFDAKHVPRYLPEYNFTYAGKFYMNSMLTAEVQVTGSICNIGNDCRGIK
ncbi:uncharacterized protein LOC122757720 [Drosophila mojavensis]|uniref:uncharacterized protein LOC122757720 n=1 Tax=Drosophila mojavensis TaxID=7230 RepID=UPI001CD0CF6B|nr:uncharacterized protein LOC122757720 [Drosophila mojavensis]